MRRLVVTAIVLAAVVLVSTLARADPLATPSSIHAIDTGLAAASPPPRPERVSYRWQLAIADTGALFAALVAPALGARDDRTVGLLAGGTFVFGAPLIHAVQGHGWRAVGSLALRVGLPLAGAWIGPRLQGEPDCPPDANLCGDATVEFGLILGVTAGVLTAVVVDTWLLAKPTHRRAKRGWSPTAASTTGGATVGIDGWF